ncbi:MAG: MlaE family lipid ABC transporter permease subunit [Candidatus Cloacimonetes bacterium]|nr:MlaE family lipid ABC transporter permease subunit [Candidatus Cloacimonadota bacterium]
MAGIRFDAGTLHLEGDFTLKALDGVDTEVAKILRQERVERIDPLGIERIDSAGTAMWEEILRLVAQEGEANVLPARPEVQAVIHRFRSPGVPPLEKPREQGWLEQIGASVQQEWQSAKNALQLAADVFAWSVVGIFRRREQRKGSLAQQCAFLGMDALPIVALLSFVIGFIIALQTGVQMKNFSAAIFVTDVMSFALVREFSPLFTAIILAGRSGSAITAEIATMKVSEEIDALRMMALDPIRYVVVPKFHALTLMMPILVTFSILAAEIGAILIAVGHLGIAPQVYLQRTLMVLEPSELFITYTKSVVFAWLIVVIAAHHGFQVRGGAEGVGRATTRSVVASILAIIVADAVFSLVYL